MTAAIEYTPEIAGLICARLAEGESLKAICMTEGCPSRKVVYNWLANRPDFLALYTQAREDQADTMAEEILEIADDSKRDIDENGKVDREVIQRAQIRVDTRKWLMQKYKARKYGDRVSVDAAVQVHGAFQWNDKYPKAQQAYFALTSVTEAKAYAQLLVSQLPEADRDELVEMFRKYQPDLVAEVERTPREVLRLEGPVERPGAAAERQTVDTPDSSAPPQAARWLDKRGRERAGNCHEGSEDSTVLEIVEEQDPGLRWANPDEFRRVVEFPQVLRRRPS